MHTDNELRSFYDNQLQQKLGAFELKRKKILTRVLFTIAALVVFVISIIGHWPIAILVASVVLAILLFATTIPIYNSYVSLYKKNIVTELVGFIHSDLEYDPKKKISEYIYRKSDLFRVRYDRYQGEDLIKGMVGQTNFACSELHTEYKTVTSDGKGKTKTEWHTIFQGLFFYADFNKELKGRTYVAPDLAEKLFGKWGQRLQKLGAKADLVKLENIDFEKEFVVHSTDQVEARYILTPAIMEALLQLKNEYKLTPHISFIHSQVYFAFETRKNLFEPKIFSSGVNFNDIKEMHHYLTLSLRIIEELNLNTRIWTKH